jgi:transcriptional regulator with XRE-family HTH domain
LIEENSRYTPILKPSQYNQYESRARQLTVEAANKICDEYDVTLDWLYRDDQSRLAHHLAIDIVRIDASEP